MGRSGMNFAINLLILVDNLDACRFRELQHHGGSSMDGDKLLEALVEKYLLSAIEVLSTISSLEWQASLLDGASSSQARKLNEISQAMAQNSLRLQEFAGTTEESFDRASSSIAASTEVISHLHLITSDMAVIEQQIRKSGSFIELLVAEFSSISQMTEVTEDIAEHLHVLAINTAVEAARAGEVGRGFTIISKEIQKLSRRASESIRDVENRVGNVRQKIDDVSASLEQSSDSARSTLSKLTSITGRFEQIREVFTLLREQLGGFREIVWNQLNSEKQIVESVRDITTESDSIAEQSGLAVGLAASLETVMQEVLKEVGSYRTSWHESSVRDLKEIGFIIADSGLGDPARLDVMLMEQFAHYPHFELFYLMNRQGVQVTSNIVNPAYRELISSQGQNVFRGSKPYFREVIDSGEPYISDIYLSTATRGLCLTVSVPIGSGPISGHVLAADMNMKDFTQRSRNEERSVGARG